jgi:hypothetical protein
VEVQGPAEAARELDEQPTEIDQIGGSVCEGDVLALGPRLVVGEVAEELRAISDSEVAADVVIAAEQEWGQA